MRIHHLVLVDQAVQAEINGHYFLGHTFLCRRLAVMIIAMMLMTMMNTYNKHHGFGSASALAFSQEGCQSQPAWREAWL
eukprot:scaffold66327_cov22-Tisochrysis_lutea.AAC.1